jgi:hypothetical protein
MTSKKQSNPEDNFSAEAISFGFDRSTDERSLALFLSCFADQKLLDTLVPRLEDNEILQVVDFITGLMHKHLSEKEYHRLFLSA